MVRGGRQDHRKGRPHLLLPLAPQALQRQRLEQGRGRARRRHCEQHRGDGVRGPGRRAGGRRGDAQRLEGVGPRAVACAAAAQALPERGEGRDVRGGGCLSLLLVLV